jgi:L-lactate dehydrogenase complex protein LldE
MLMATCLCDLFFDDVAAATVEVLEHLGCRVVVPEDQTCCGQPAFNGGDWPAARRVARHTASVFAGELPIVIPSGSCARMVGHGSALLFERDADRADQAAQAATAGRAWELCDFVVRSLGVRRWGGKLDAKVAFHRSCHSRGTGYGDAAITLLGSIEGLHLVEVGEQEQCCGFGGTFSVSFPGISNAIGSAKLDAVFGAGPDLLVSADMGCLMHLEGLARKAGRPLRVRHVAQVLRDSLS